MLYKKLKELGLIEIDNVGNIKIIDENKFENYFKNDYNENNEKE